MTAAAASAEGIEVRALPVRYPQGGEKQLIYATTKRKVPCGGLPLDVGVVVANVGTCYAIDRAIREGRPLVERVTTVGGLVNKPSNFLVRIGTPISHLIEAAGGMEDGVKQLLSGGPMMGMAISPHRYSRDQGLLRRAVLGPRGRGARRERLHPLRPLHEGLPHEFGSRQAGFPDACRALY